eukprot:3743794-Rhodomonas_salina.4
MLCMSRCFLVQHPSFFPVSLRNVPSFYALPYLPTLCLPLLYAPYLPLLFAVFLPCISPRHTLSLHATPDLPMFYPISLCHTLSPYGVHPTLCPYSCAIALRHVLRPYAVPIFLRAVLTRRMVLPGADTARDGEVDPPSKSNSKRHVHGTYQTHKDMSVGCGTESG